MSKLTARFFTQPLIAVLAGVAGLISLATTFTVPIFGPAGQELYALTLALLLLVFFVLANLYPIHIRHRTKVAVSTVALYMMAVLLPPFLASVTAGLGWLIAGLLMRSRTGNLLSDIATAAGRWVMIAALASSVAHLPAADALSHMLVLLGTAGIMFAGDMLTLPFELAPMTREPFARLLTGMIRELGAIETVQYMIGILGALAVFQQGWALVLLGLPVAIVYLIFRNLKEMQTGTRELLMSMADAVDLRDPSTGGHSRRVAELCKQILQVLAIGGSEADLICMAARVHDIGKVDIPDEILSKNNRLTPEEWRIMKTHVERGADLLVRYADFARGVECVRYHHERWDGQGYPRGLKKLDIPLGARVIAVADAYDAMTSDRPYRRAMSANEAVALLRADSGRHWDPAVVDAMLCALGSENQDALASVRADLNAAPSPALE